LRSQSFGRQFCPSKRYFYGVHIRRHYLLASVERTNFAAPRRARERVPLADFRLFVIVSRPDDLQLRHDDEEAFRQKAKAAESSGGKPPARFSPLLLSLVKPHSPRGDHASHKPPRAATPSDPLFRSLVTLPDLPAAHMHHHWRR